MAERGALGLTAAPRRHDPVLGPAVIRNRLRELQALCTDVDALLFVSGVDGQYNEGSRKVLNFLLCGYSGSDVFHSTLTHPDLEDILLLVSRKECFLYMGNSETYWKYLPLLGPIEDLQLFSTLPDEEKDSDLAEERKILCFLEMVEPFKRIGMALSHRPKDINDVRSKPSAGRWKGQAGEQPAMEVESWPLVQVYGVEELGYRGFFTLKHTVEDVGERVDAALMAVDRGAVESLLTQHVDLLAFHWETALGSLDMHRPAERLRVSEAGLAEPLQSYFQYGLLRAADSEAQQRRRPLCAMGLRSNLAAAAEEEQRPSPDAGVKVGGSGVEGKAAVHFALEGAEPNGPLQAARTYFLSSGGAAARVRSFGWDGEETAEEDNKLERAGLSAYARGLMVAYQALRAVGRELMEAFCKGEEETEAGLRGLGVRRLEGLGLEWLKKSDIRQHLAVSLSAADMAGRACAAERGSRAVKYLRLALPHIMSLDMAPRDLGGVLYGESFVEVGGAGGEGGRACVLTAGIEQLAGWMGAGQEEDTEYMAQLLHRLRASKKHVHMSMGALLHEEPLGGVRLVTGREDLPWLQGELWVLARGLIFVAHRTGSLALDFTHALASLHWRAGGEEEGGQGVEAAVELGLSAPLQRFGILEASLASAPAAPLLLALRIAGPDRRLFTREVLPAWRDWAAAHHLPASPLPDAPASRDPAPAPQRKASAEGAVAVYDLAQPRWAGALRALQAADTARHSPAPPRPLPAAQRRVRVQVLLGEPGTDKRRMAEGLMQMARPARRRPVVCYASPPHAMHCIDPAALAKTVLGGAGAGGGVCVVVSTFASAVEVVRGLATEELRRAGVQVERVAAVVSAPSVQGAGSGAVEVRVAGQCAGGCVDAVVLANAEALSPAALAAAQQHLRLLNPLARIVRAVAGMVVAAGDVESLMGPDDGEEEEGGGEGGGAGRSGRFGAGAAGELRDQLWPQWRSPLPGLAEAGRLSVWGAWKGPCQQLSFASHPPLRFVRAPLLKAVRALCASPLASLSEYVAAHGDGAVAAMEVPASPGRVLSVSGTVMVYATEEAAAAGGEAQASVVKGKRGFVTVTPCKKGAAPAELRVAVAGRRLDPAAVVRVLLQGRAAPPAPKAVRTARELTEAEREALRKKSIGEPLPEDTFFNGSAYIDFSGETLPEHPAMPRLVADFLRDENLAAEKHNAEAEQLRKEHAAAEALCVQEATASLQHR